MRSEYQAAGIATAIIGVVTGLILRGVPEFLRSDYAVALISAVLTGFAALVALHAAHYPERQRRKEARTFAAVELSSWGLMLDDVSAALTVARNSLRDQQAIIRTADVAGWTTNVDRTKKSHDDVIAWRPSDHEAINHTLQALKQARMSLEEAYKKRDAALTSCRAAKLSTIKVKDQVNRLEGKKILAFDLRAASKLMQLQSAVSYASDSIDFADTEESMQLSIDYLNKAIQVVMDMRHNEVTRANLTLETEKGS